MRLLEETRARWKATLDGKDNIAALREAVNQPPEQNPCLIGLRSICWKSFLLFETLDTSSWSKTLADSRSAYTSLKDHYTRSLSNPDDLSADDPLADGETSPWNTLRQDEEIRAEIFQDVERCMPENAHFREPKAQGILLEILFIYCKLNRDIGYRQGMHEVLAPILWVVYCDALEGDHEEPNDLICQALDADYIEHDAFVLFGSLMRNVKSFYEMGNSSDPVTTGMLNNSPIVERSKRIHENYLHHADPELAEHLTSIEILPQIFLIRWMRLLFGREFPFDEVLALWDLLFAEDSALDLIDFISVSMLLRIRWQLLEADYTAALTLLLRYPVPSAPYGPPSFVGDALYLRENLHLDGGHHLISKYSQKSPETTVTRKLPKKIKRTRKADQKAAKDAVPPSMSPSRLLQEQGGIENIIHEAARGIYNRGERWGVAKALKGAVQGLQAVNASPGRAGERKAGSSQTSEGASSGRTRSDLLAEIESLESRNKALAKMLATSMNELWSQQREVKADEEKKGGSEALSLAIAKVQFVQVYLENSQMPLPADMLSAADEQASVGGLGAGPGNADIAPPGREKTPSPPATVDGPIDEKAVPTRVHSKGRKTQTRGQPKTPPNLSPQARPSLSQSPYSWMLGEEQKQKSGFVAASPFSAGNARQKERKEGGIFGNADKGVGADDEDDIFSVARRKR